MSTREEDSTLLVCLRNGMTSPQIAEKLDVSLRTIEHRRKRLMDKYRARTPFQLGYRVKQSGFGDL